MGHRAALLEELHQIALELKTRGPGHTEQILGELGEHLALDVYGGTLETVSSADIDLSNAVGRRIQVKACELPAAARRPFQFSSLEFDVAACMRFDRATFRLKWAREIVRAEFAGIVTPHKNGPRVTITRVARPGFDATERCHDAWAKLEQ